MTADEPKKKFKFQWWHYAASVFVILVTIFCGFWLFGRKDWVEPIDVAGFRFDPIRKNVDFHFLNSQSAFKILVKAVEDYELVVDKYWDEDEWNEQNNKREESAFGKNHFDLNKFSRIKDMLLEVEPVFNGFVKDVRVGSLQSPTYNSVQDLLFDLKLDSFAFTLLDYIHLSSREGDLKEVEIYLNAFIDVCLCLERVGPSVCKVRSVSWMQCMLESLAYMDVSNLEISKFSQIYNQGIGRYLRDRMAWEEVLRFDYMLLSGLLRDFVETGEGLPNRLTTKGLGGLIAMSDFEESQLNLSRAWCKVLTAADSKRRLYGSDVILQDLPFGTDLRGLGKYLIKDPFGYYLASFSLSFPDFENEEKLHSLSQMISVYLSILHSEKVNGVLPQSASQITCDVPLSEIGVFYTFYDNADWYVTNFDSRGKDLREFHKWNHDLDENIILHPFKSRLDLWEGPVEDEE